VLVLLSRLDDGGAHTLFGFHFDAETDDLMLANEDVVSVCHNKYPRNEKPGTHA
jgi:hypothetical protein